MKNTNIELTKTETITIRTTSQEKKQIERIAAEQRRTVGGLLYIWVVDKLKEENKNHD